MRLIGALRRDRRGASPVTDNILTVAVIVGIVLLAYVMSVVGSGPFIGGTIVDSIDVSVRQRFGGLNWVLTFGHVPAAMANATVFLSITDLNGEPQLAFTSLSALGGVAERYSPITAGGDIAEGDRILLAVSAYPAGWTYQLNDFNANDVLAGGPLR